MRFSKSKYPVGARFELIENGKHAYIGLSQKTDKFEVWYFGWCYSDGSKGKSDWATSYKNARSNLNFKGKFKRVK